MDDEVFRLLKRLNDQRRKSMSDDEMNHRISKFQKRTDHFLREYFGWPMLNLFDLKELSSLVEHEENAKQMDLITNNENDHMRSGSGPDKA